MYMEEKHIRIVKSSPTVLLIDYVLASYNII